MAAFASGLLQPPWIKAAYPWVATPYGHTTMYPGGAYRRSLGSLYLTLLGFSYAIPELLANEVRTDGQRERCSGRATTRVSAHGVAAFYGVGRADACTGQGRVVVPD